MGQYEAFWQAPTETPTVWVGLLFAILSLGASLYELANKNSAGHGLMPSAHVLSQKFEQCLVLGKYATAEEHSLEALMIHTQGCFVRANDSDAKPWFLMGIITRLAIRLGYHRDPATFPNATLSPFYGEMRRRVWTSIVQVDALISFQMGLPSMIPSEYCDTDLPRNLEYSDFGPETTVLPPSRPFSDYTPIMYTIAKNPVVAMFKTVVGHTQSLLVPPYERTLALDGQLRTAYNNVPDNLRYKPLEQCVVDSPGVIMNRATIEILYLKSVIVLHRRYIKTNRQDARYDFSRNACLEAALHVLDRQKEMYRATQPGGQLHGDRWIGSTLATNDFILAGMILCLELTLRIRQPANKVANNLDVARCIAAVQVSHDIWVAASAFSTEARIAAHALESTVRRVKAHAAGAPSSPASQSSHATGSQLDFSSHLGQLSVHQQPASEDGMEYIDWVSLFRGRYWNPL
ncbi:Transcription factor [Niveomyces insectorum RCEF 264]|uniref:Transcription factor n=1 Tax=Niveomyces insectorum RCEF 264 TaxID=1081102 RepID=A0A167NS87_9HYPO|nr:Transcription factor [Niveomyces insectorum RCEF 264]